MKSFNTRELLIITIWQSAQNYYLYKRKPYIDVTLLLRSATNYLDSGYEKLILGT
ncbi:MAG: hypothetical protein HXS46_01260 [Theionarchaea archaeon]|nr:hypothetical protein [Theionarchaea archaeon]